MEAWKIYMHKRNFVIAVLFVVSIACIIFSGCVGVPVRETSSGKDKYEVTIGAVLPQSGAFAMVGLEALNGMKLAADIINMDMIDVDVPLGKGAGLPKLNGAKVRIVAVDHKDSADHARNETERLLIQEKCVSLLGTYTQVTTVPALSVAEQYGVPFLDDSTTSPLFSQTENLWYFRTAAEDSTLSEMIHPFFRNLKEKEYIQEGKLAYLHPGTALSTKLVSASLKQSRDYKYSVVADIAFVMEEAPVAGSALAVKMKALGASVVWQYSNEAETRELIRAYKNNDFNPEGILLASSSGRDAQQALGKDFQYIVAVDRWSPDLKDKKSLFDKVNRLYKQKFGYDMGEYAVRGFTSVLIICDAINRAGTTDPKAVRNAMETSDIPGKQLLMPWKGVKFDAKTHHNISAAGIITQMREKQRVTVWPPASASTEAIWPMPRWKERNRESQ